MTSSKTPISSLPISRSVLSIVLVIAWIPMLIYEYHHWYARGRVFASLVLSFGLFQTMNIARRIDKIETSDGIQGTLDRMELYKHDAEAQTQGLRVLEELLCERIVLRGRRLDQARKLSVFRRLFCLTSNFEENAELLTQFIQTIVKIGVEFNNYYDALRKNDELKDMPLYAAFDLEAKDIEPFIQMLLRKKSADVELYRLTILFLGSLVSKSPKEQEEAALTLTIDSHSPRFILKTMKHFQSIPSSEGVQQWGAWALFNFVQPSKVYDKLYPALFGNELMQTLVKSMELYPSHQKFQQLACMLLMHVLLKAKQSDAPSSTNASYFENLRVMPSIALSYGILPILQCVKQEFPEDQSLHQMIDLIHCLIKSLNDNQGSSTHDAILD